VVRERGVTASGGAGYDRSVSFKILL